MKYDIEKHLLPLEGATNARELGGYPTKDGFLTRCGRFIRCDKTSTLTEKDVAYLKELGVTMAVDLRSREELMREPSVLDQDKDISYRNVTMLDDLYDGIYQGQFPDHIGDLYVKMLESSKLGFARIFQIFSACQEACLFHCTAGKDRTGIVSMLLLDLANVETDIIIADYAATEIFQETIRLQQMALLEEQGIQIPEGLLKSDPQNMVTALSHLHLRYGGASGYLRDCGLKQEDLDTIISRFIEMKSDIAEE